jgi:hypothetical protein
MITVRGGVCELIEPAAEPGHGALPLESGDRSCCDAGPADFGEAGNTVLAQKRSELFPLGARLGRYSSWGRSSFHPRKCIMRRGYCQRASADVPL